MHTDCTHPSLQELVIPYFFESVSIKTVRHLELFLSLTEASSSAKHIRRLQIPNLKPQVEDIQDDNLREKWLTDRQQLIAQSLSQSTSIYHVQCVDYTFSQHELL